MAWWWHPDVCAAWKEPDDGQEVEQARRAAARVLSSLQIAPISRYSDALVQTAGMTALFDETVYRLLDVDLTGGAKRMIFTRSSYFSYLDTCEILTFEAELRRAAGKRIDGWCSLRRKLGDPFRLRNRVASLGVDTLTVRVENDRAGFLPAWKPELLTICLIEAKEFDAIFTPIPNRNDEGTILMGNGRDGLPFTARTVAQYCAESTISSNAKATLQLAWQFRTEIGLNRGHPST